MIEKDEDKTKNEENTKEMSINYGYINYVFTCGREDIRAVII